MLFFSSEEFDGNLTQFSQFEMKYSQIDLFNCSILTVDLWTKAIN